CSGRWCSQCGRLPPASAACRPIARFFFQAEDGIRDKLVTGVQTCALPIFGIASFDQGAIPIVLGGDHSVAAGSVAAAAQWAQQRSEERRVGKECRGRGTPGPRRRKKRGVGPHGSWSRERARRTGAGVVEVV